MLFNALLSLCLAAMAMAAPLADEVSIQRGGDAWQYGTGGGIIGFIVLVLDIIVWIEVLKSNRPVLHKVLWALLVFLFPIGGIIIYWLFSNREAHKSDYEPIAG
nr:hypothetical protein CFP56_07629 [Quercus suber]